MGPIQNHIAKRIRTVPADKPDVKMKRARDRRFRCDYNTVLYDCDGSKFDKD